MMNDETRELLSAYLDGALPEAERLSLEARLAASADLRRELEELRAVSRAVRELPREPLPAGFLARLQARRARGEKPRQDWVFLPPAARPVVMALSFGLVALVIWDKVAVEPPETPLHPRYAAKVEDAADAPVAQFDVSRRAAGGGAAGGALESSGEAVDGKSLSVAGPVPETIRRGDVLPDVPEKAETAAAEAGAKLSAVAASRGARTRAAGHPLENGSAAGAAQGLALTDRTKTAMTEEERSARNEAMFGFLEQQKKKMGIKVLSKKDSIAATNESRMFGAPAPAAPAISAPTPTLLKRAERDRLAAESAAAPARAPGSGRLAPDAALVFSDARSLASSWILLGFPGTPPATDFSSGRLLLIKPSAAKILSVSADAGAVTVVYRSLEPDEASNPARDRVAPIPAEPKTVLIYDASPR